MCDRDNTYTSKEERAKTAHVIWDVFLSVFIASSPGNLVKVGMQLHFCILQAIKSWRWVRPENKACVIHLPLFRPWQTSQEKRKRPE